MTERSVIVIGAGVIGLSTALQLVQKGYKQVSVIAKFIPGDLNIEYTSPYAGAHWRTMAKNDDHMLQSFDTITYKRFLQLATSADNTGIMILPSYDYYDDSLSPEISDPWFKDIVENFEFLTEKDGLPNGARLGHRYDTVLINTPLYLQWLAAQFKALGGQIIQRNLGHIDEVFSLAENPLVVNCTGLGARFLGGVNDEKMYPVRGQTVIVKAPHIKRTITHVGAQGINYVIPRSDGTVILGGTTDKDDFNPFSHSSVNELILERTALLCPELKQRPLEIVRYAVGLRPYRIGGPRIENEYQTSRNKKVTVQVTHGYGHGGFGVQSSWGSAQQIIEVMESGIKPSSSKANNAARL